MKKIITADRQKQAQLEEQLHAAYQEGWDAYEGGADFNYDNPYAKSEPEASKAWRDGFNAAYKDEKERARAAFPAVLPSKRKNDFGRHPLESNPYDDKGAADEGWTY